MRELSELEHLRAVEDIKQLKARYFRDVDTKCWEDLSEVFTADAVFDLRAVNSIPDPRTGELKPPLGGADLVYTGRAQIVSMIRDVIGSMITIHHGYPPEIDIVSTDSARGIWPMEDILRDAAGGLALHGFGHYRETYQRELGIWRIKTSMLTRLHVSGALR
jgi:hypothetical protein